MMTGIGQIISVNTQDAKVSVKILQQAGANEFSFGDPETMNEYDDVEKDTDIVEYSFEDILSSSWRLATS